MYLRNRRRVCGSERYSCVHNSDNLLIQCFSISLKQRRWLVVCTYKTTVPSVSDFEISFNPRRFPLEGNGAVRLRADLRCRQPIRSSFNNVYKSQRIITSLLRDRCSTISIPVFLEISQLLYGEPRRFRLFDSRCYRHKIRCNFLGKNEELPESSIGYV